MAALSHTNPHKLPLPSEQLKAELPLLYMLYQAQEHDAITIKQLYKNNMSNEIGVEIQIETLYPDIHIEKLIKYLDYNWKVKVRRTDLRTMHILMDRYAQRKEIIQYEYKPFKAKYEHKFI